MDNSDYIKKKKRELTENIKNSEEELKNLRKLCRHTETKIKNINPEYGSSLLRKVCNACGEVLGFPTNEELKRDGYTSK